MNKVLFVLSMLLFTFSCNQSYNSNTVTEYQLLRDTLTDELSELHQNGYIKGFGVSIVNEDTTLYAGGVGFSEVTVNRPYTVDTRQNIASVSKTLIGIALLKAQEMGKLNLDDPINQYLPFEVLNPFYPEERITIRHLATHTSTILDGDLYSEKAYVLVDSADYELAKSLPSSGEFNLPSATMDLEQYLRHFLSSQGDWYLQESFMKAKPGDFYEYSNVGATLTAYLIEKTTGQPYSEFTTKYILEPLEMRNSGWYFEANEMSNYTKLYTTDGKEIPYYSLITYPDGGFLTSIADMSKYLSELIGGYVGQGELLMNESYQQIFSTLLASENFQEERDTDRPFDDEYNSGIFMGHTPNGSIGHMGGDPGTSTFLFFNPETGIGKLLFVNTDLDAKGAEQFYAIWDKLGGYEEKLSMAIME